MSGDLYDLYGDARAKNPEISVENAVSFKFLVNDLNDPINPRSSVYAGDSAPPQ